MDSVNVMSDPTQSDQPQVIHSLRTVLSWLTRRRKLQLALLVLLSMVGAVAELATLGAILPFVTLLDDRRGALDYPLIRDILEWFGWSEAWGILIPVTVLFCGIVVVAAGLRILLTYSTMRFTEGLGHELSVRVYDRVLHQPYPFHVSRNTSEVLAGLDKVSSVVGGVLKPALDVFIAIVMATAILTGLLVIDRDVALLAAGLFGLVYWAIAVSAKKRLFRNSRTISRSKSDRLRAMQEGLGGIRDILLDGSQELHLARFKGYDHAHRMARVFNALWTQIPRYLVEALGVGVIAGLAVFTALRAGGLSEALPVLAALALGAQRLFPLFQRIYSGWAQVAGNQGNTEDVALLADALKPEGWEVRGDPTQLPFTRCLTLDGLGFRYRPDAPWVFRDLNLEIPKGASVGFVGETGCGKTTLLDVIMGLLAPTVGRMSVDGTCIIPQNRAHWQARIAHVPQSIFLTDASLAENIAFGELAHRIDMERVRVAARRARIHDFISTLPKGYETRVGERGARLSGGQRQRIGIARALYRRADVLILDEATSALDHQTEALVMDGIGKIDGDVTILMVAHRLSTLDGCDFVVKMERGVIEIEHSSTQGLAP
jgi:ATP-binding cassette, subfamily B, bacterial PglK